MTPAETQVARVSKARARLLLSHPWFGALALRLRVEDDPTHPAPMATNGTTLLLNSRTLPQFGDRDVETIVAHEVLHCALVHPYRFNGREHMLWNIACDYVTNLILIENGFVIPRGALVDHRFAGMAAEQVYAILHKEREEERRNQPDPQPGEGGEGGPGDGGQPQDLDPAPVPTSQETRQQGSGHDMPASAPATGDTPSGEKNDAQTTAGDDSTMTAADWEIATLQATAVALKAGSMPAGVDRAVKTAYEPVVDWRAVLRRFVEETLPADYSWTTPNRRYVSRGIYLPGTVREGLPRMAVAIDTSGSIDQEMLDRFAAELQGILHEARPETLTVIYCDAAVAGTEDFTPDDEVVLHAKGGGGTRFSPVFEHVAGWDEPPVCLIYATDLEAYDAPEEPEYPTLWLTTPGTRKMPPFGEVVRMQEENA